MRGKRESGRRGGVRLAIGAAAIAASFAVGAAVGPGLPSWLAEAPAIETVPAHGLTASEWQFLRHFDRPLALDIDESLPAAAIQRALRDDLAADFAAKGHLLAERYPALSEPELLVSYLALRVSMSLPVLDSGMRLQRALKPLLLSPRGNCLHHAVRAAFVMDAFALPARIVLLSSPPHIMGHAVADVYDAEHRLAALVDTNKKMVFFLRDADAGFFETVLAERDEAKRRTIMESAVVVTFPMDVRYFNPSDGHLAVWVAGKGEPVILDQVRADLAEGRVRKTKAAFIEGYRKLFTTRTRGDETWWLRIQSLADYERIVDGLAGQVAVDNSAAQAVIDRARDEITKGGPD